MREILTAKMGGAHFSARKRQLADRALQVDDCAHSRSGLAAPEVRVSSTDVSSRAPGGTAVP